MNRLMQAIQSVNLFQVSGELRLRRVVRDVLVHQRQELFAQGVESRFLDFVRGECSHLLGWRQVREIRHAQCVHMELLSGDSLRAFVNRHARILA